jgi:phosphopantetheine--protein transferase-like protein
MHDPIHLREQLAEIHLVKSDYHKKGFSLDVDLAVCDPQEQARFQRLRFPDKARLWLHHRAAIRRILAPQLRIQPADLVWRYDIHGKPSLQNAPGLGINWSHTGAWLAIAIKSFPGVIGVDIETVQAQRRYKDLAERFFAPSEADLISNETERQEGMRLFHQAWAAKEALAKARGTGLGTVNGTSLHGDTVLTFNGGRVTIQPGPYPVCRSRGYAEGQLWLQPISPLPQELVGFVATVELQNLSCRFHESFFR